MLTSNDLPAARISCASLRTRMGRDMPGVDLALDMLKSTKKAPGGSSSVHCIPESLYEGQIYRPSQLAMLLTLCKGTPFMSGNVVAGLVGVNMTAINIPKHEHPSNNSGRMDGHLGG
nr:hypothetical protein CFP56_77500 [Quercus suber]